MRLNAAYAPAARTLGNAITEGFDVDYNPALPLVWALGVLTGLPYYPAAIPVVLTACEAGIGIWDVNGYWVGGFLPGSANLLPPNASDKRLAAVTYGGSVALLGALPTRLTYSALNAIGFDFDYGVTPDSPAPLPVAAYGLTLGVAPNGAAFTVTGVFTPGGTAETETVNVNALGAGNYVTAYAPATGYAAPNASGVTV